MCLTHRLTPKKKRKKEKKKKRGFKEKDINNFLAFPQNLKTYIWKKRIK